MQMQDNTLRSCLSPWCTLSAGRERIRAGQTQRCRSCSVSGKVKTSVSTTERGRTLEDDHSSNCTSQECATLWFGFLARSLCMFSVSCETRGQVSPGEFRVRNCAKRRRNQLMLAKSQTFIIFLCIGAKCCEKAASRLDVSS